MATFKTVWQFVESNGATFSETWYKEGSNISSVVDPAGQSVALRLTFLDSTNTLLRIRVSQVGTLRNTQNVLINKNGTAPGTAGPLAAGAAVVLSIAGIGGGSRKLWMRGNDRADFTRDDTTGRDTPNPVLVGQIKAWMTALGAEGYGILRQTPIVNPVTQITNITKADGTVSPGLTVLTVVPQIFVAAGGTVVISKVNQKELPRLQGRFTLVAVGMNTITINYATPGNALVNVLSGKVKALAFDATHIVDPTRSGFDHFGTRSTKVGIFGSRGAKRAQRIRLLA